MLDDFLEQLPEAMRDALEGQEPEFAAELARAYLEADERTQADMFDFFERDGLRLVREAILLGFADVPTSAELERWWLE